MSTTVLGVFRPAFLLALEIHSDTCNTIRRRLGHRVVRA